MIRKAIAADVPELVQMGARFFAVSPWSGRVDLDREHVTTVLAGLIGGDASEIFVLERGGSLHGAIGIFLAPVFFAPASSLAQEAFWWCEPSAGMEAFRLLDAAAAWAKEKGACLMHLIRIDGLRDGALDAVYRRKGFAPVEHHYAREL